MGRGAGLRVRGLASPDDVVRASLHDRHRRFRVEHGAAVRYDPAVASFVAVPATPTEQDWADLAALVGPGGLADLFSATAPPPTGWEPAFELEGQRMTFSAPVPGPVAAVVEPLGPDDADDVRALAAQTRPGPFFARTHELGRFVGVRADGVLLAMAGERLRPPGGTEISAVCTRPEARGRGLVAAVVAALVRDVLDRGEVPFLHVMRANAGALALYRRLGFEVSDDVVFRGYRVP
ncbi:GNAT family N-acetyltransferase [Nocardioides sp. C4-1]|uniref:GNAT family N-acetyltransferase n=1 Tax=Nocardioides sp. C4-1 TaxID=3151851 RepID=UPI0032674056